MEGHEVTAFLYVVPEGTLSVKGIAKRKPRANAKPKPNATPKAPVKFTPSGQADRYLVTDAVLAAYLAETDPAKRAALLPEPSAASASPIHPSAETFAAMLLAWGARTDGDVADGAAFDVATADAAAGILVVPRGDGDATPEPDLRSLFVIPATPSDAEAEATPEPSGDDAAQGETRRK